MRPARILGIAAAAHNLCTPLAQHQCAPLLLSLLPLYAAPRYKPEVAQQQLFNFSPSQPFKRGTGWLAWGLIGVAAAPVVVGSTALLLSAVGYDNAVAGGRGTVDGVAGMVTLDLPTYVRLVSVTGEQGRVAAQQRVTGSEFAAWLGNVAALLASPGANLAARQGCSISVAGAAKRHQVQSLNPIHRRQQCTVPAILAHATVTCVVPAHSMQSAPNQPAHN